MQIIQNGNLPCHELKKKMLQTLSRSATSVQELTIQIEGALSELEKKKKEWLNYREGGGHRHISGEGQSYCMDNQKQSSGWWEQLHREQTFWNEICPGAQAVLLAIDKLSQYHWWMIYNRNCQFWYRQRRWVIWSCRIWFWVTMCPDRRWGNVLQA